VKHGNLGLIPPHGLLTMKASIECHTYMAPTIASTIAPVVEPKEEAR
jgi:hypothetical protein